MKCLDKINYGSNKRVVLDPTREKRLPKVISMAVDLDTRFCAHSHRFYKLITFKDPQKEKTRSAPCLPLACDNTTTPTDD